MGKTNSISEAFEMVQIAASFEAENASPSLFQMLGYRKAIALQLLRSNGDNREHLTKMFNRANYDIGRILGVKIASIED